MKFSLLISPIDFAWGNSKANKPFSLYLPKTTGVHTYLSYKKINFIIEQKIQILKVLSALILIYCYENKTRLITMRSKPDYVEFVLLYLLLMLLWFLLL